MIRYWIKILSSSNTFIPKIIYSMLKTDLDNNITYNGSNWAFQIKNILDDLGFSNIWIHQNDIDIPFNLIKQRLLDTYKQSWYSTINNSNRLETYARCKHEFEIEKYLDFMKEKKFKFALTQFRLSSHNLAIERGRFENIARTERVCVLCNSNLVENEYHFLLVCSLYRELRKQYLKPYFCRWPTLNKFDALMSNTNRKSLLNVAKFIYYAMNLRQINIV